MSVRRRESLRAGKLSFSRNRGLASMSFRSSRSMMLRADLVSPYLDSCSLSLRGLVEADGSVSGTAGTSDGGCDQRKKRGGWPGRLPAARISMT
jgi:hypothetical protein